MPSRIVSGLSLLPAYAVRRPVCIALRALRRRSGYPALCQAADLIAHRLGGLLILRPRGPRSGPGYSVPVRHHLIDPIRPTRRHITISPHGGLYAMPSLAVISDEVYQTTGLPREELQRKEITVRGPTAPIVMRTVFKAGNLATLFEQGYGRFSGGSMKANSPREIVRVLSFRSSSAFGLLRT